MNMLEAEGGCLCGAVRYQVSGRPYHLTHCHCTLCRRASGAPFVTWFSVASAGFLVTRGEPIRYRSSPVAVRGFCGRCGAQLIFQRDDTPGEVDITDVQPGRPRGADARGPHLHAQPTALGRARATDCPSTLLSAKSITLDPSTLPCESNTSPCGPTHQRLRVHERYFGASTGMR